MSPADWALLVGAWFGFSGGIIVGMLLLAGGRCVHPQDALVFDGVWQGFEEIPSTAAVTCSLCHGSFSLPMKHGLLQIHATQQPPENRVDSFHGPKVLPFNGRTPSESASNRKDRGSSSVRS